MIKVAEIRYKGTFDKCVEKSRQWKKEFGYFIKKHNNYYCEIDFIPGLETVVHFSVFKDQDAEESPDINQ